MSGLGLGELPALGCALLSAGGVISLKRFLQRADPMVITIFQTAASALFAAICTLYGTAGASMAGAVPSVWFSIPYLVLGCTLGGYMLQNTASRMIFGRRFVPDALCSAMTAKENSEASHPYGRAAPPKRSRGRIPAPASLFFAAIPIFYLPLKSLSKYGCGKNSSFHWRSGSGSLLSVLPVEWISFFKTSFSTAMSMGFAI